MGRILKAGGQVVVAELESRQEPAEHAAEKPGAPLPPWESTLRPLLCKIAESLDPLRDVSVKERKRTGPANSRE